MWSAWKHCKSDGTIPEDLLPCDAFQVRWFCMWDYDIVDPMRMTETLRGEWHWKIVNDSGIELFFSRNKVAVQFTWMSFGMFGGGGLAFATWAWNSASDRVLTTIPEWSNRPLDGTGNPIWANPTDWRGTSVPYAPATEQPYLSPGGGSADIAHHSFAIQTTWHGGIYEVSIPQGARWQVPFHNVGATALVKLANLEMRTSKGGDSGACTDVAGFMRNGVFEQDRAVQCIYPNGTQMSETRLIVPGLRSPQLLKSRSNVLYCLGEKGMYWRLFQSFNDGHTWETVTDVWDPGYQNARYTILPDGEILSVAMKGSTCYSKRIGGVLINVGYGMTAPISIVHDNRRGTIVVDSTGATWLSKDGGNTWERSL